MSEKILPAPFNRRLGAGVYDLVALTGVVMVATLFAIAFCNILLGVDFVKEPDYLNTNPLYWLFIVGIVFFLYTYSWVHGGQTIGMRTWRLTLVDPISTKVSWRQAIIRFFIFPLAFGSVTILLTDNKNTIQDSLSKTKMIYKPKYKRDDTVVFREKPKKWVDQQKERENQI